MYHSHKLKSVRFQLKGFTAAQKLSFAYLLGRTE